MSFTELWFRRIVIWAARGVPVESPGWATLGVFAPNFVSFILVRGTIREAVKNPFIAAILSPRTLFWTELLIQVGMGMVGLAFLCRLLQICDVKYFDKYKLEDSK